MKAPATGYSGTPLPAKLGIKTGMRFFALNAPANLDALLAGAPKVERLARLAGFDFALAFATSERAVAAALDRLATKMADAGMIWIAWPKKSSGVATDLSEDVVRRVGLAASGSPPSSSMSRSARSTRPGRGSSSCGDCAIGTDSGRMLCNAG